MADYGSRWLLILSLIGGLACAAPIGAEAAAMDERPAWELEGRDWPNRSASRFVEAGGLRWHYQRLGQGPALLLVHGTGAATHSWHRLAQRLAEHFTVIAPDLPGHGFTSWPSDEQFALPGMADLLAQFLAATEVSPRLVVGHSAGAAILARMSIDGRIAPEALISLNGALLARRGFAFRLFAPIVRAVVTTDLAAKAFAWHASDRDVVSRTLAGTGSQLDADELDWYARLFRTPGHTGAALMMMAKWELETLEADLPTLARPVLLVVGEDDGFIAPSEASEVASLLPQASVLELPGLGHLAHEERPDLIANLIVELARDRGVIEQQAAVGQACSIVSAQCLPRASRGSDKTSP